MRRASIRWCYRESIEVHVAIRLGPEANAPRNGLGQGVLKVELAVEITFHWGASNVDLELMPLMAGSRRVPNPLHRGALALFKLPQYEIIFETVRPDRQIAAVWFQVEEDAGTLIDPAGNAFEAHRKLAL